MEGLDYSFTRPDLAEVVEAGYRFVVRYLCTYPACAGKVLTADELADIRGHGLDLAVVWEYDTHDALEGFPAGWRHGSMALSQARSLGLPDTMAIYFAVDFDATPEQLVTVADYFRGIASVVPIGRVGVYGGIRTIRTLHAAGVVTWLWQTYAWSNGQVYGPTHVYQYSNGHMIAGAICDLNTARVPSFGQWETGEAMTFNDDDRARLIASDNRIREILLKGSEVYDDVPGEGPAQRPWLVAELLAIHADVAAVREQLNAGTPVVLSDAQVDAIVDSLAARMSSPANTRALGVAIAQAGITDLLARLEK